MAEESENKPHCAGCYKAGVRDGTVEAKAEERKRILNIFRKKAKLFRSPTSTITAESIADVLEELAESIEKGTA